MQEVQQIAVTALPAPSFVEIWAAGIKIWLDILTALGTVGAVAAAIWFATRDGRERREQQRSEAIISGWLIAPEVAELTSTVKALRRAFTDIIATHVSGLAMQNGMRHFLLYTAERMDMPLTTGRIPHLADLRGGTGHALAALVGQVPKLKRSVIDLVSWDGPLTEEQVRICRMLLEGCSLLEKHLAHVDLRDNGEY